MDTSGLFPPPDAAASLYRGSVMHARMKPKAHRFSYKVFSLLIDLGRLEEAGRLSRFFSLGRFNLLSFDERDHGPRDGSSLVAYVRGEFADKGIDLEGGRVLLLCYPRVLGYVFNPLSVYFAYDRDGTLKGILYEVRNTFKEMHSYVLPVEAGMLTQAGVRQAQDKLFYVSPFLDMAMRYHFRVRPPTCNVAVRILETDADGPILAATFAGERFPLTSRTVLVSCIALPFMTLKVMAGIHWEALKLWMKGIRIQPYGTVEVQPERPSDQRSA